MAAFLYKKAKTIFLILGKGKFSLGTNSVANVRDFVVVVEFLTTNLKWFEDDSLLIKQKYTPLN